MVYCYGVDLVKNSSYLLWNIRKNNWLYILCSWYRYTRWCFWSIWYFIYQHLVFLKDKKVYDILKGGNEQELLNIIANMFKEDVNDIKVDNTVPNQETDNELEIDTLPEFLTK